MSDLSQVLKPCDIMNLEGYMPFDWRHPLWAWSERRAIDLIVDIQGFVFNSKLKSKTIHTRDNHSTMYMGGGQFYSQEPPNAVILPLSDYENDKGRIVSVYRLNPVYFKRDLTDADMELMLESCHIMAQRKVPYDIARDVEDGVNDLTQSPWDASLNILDAKCNMSEDPNIINSSVCSQAVAIHLTHWRHQTQAKTGELIVPPWKNLNTSAWIDSQIQRYPHYWDCAIVHPSNYAVTHECFNDEFVLIGRFRGGQRIA